MLPKAHRLRHYRDFSAVYQKGMRRSSAHLTLRVLKRPKNGSNGGALKEPQLSQPSRIGISISQKVSKRAVIRNRIKRQLRAICRELYPWLILDRDIIIIVHPTATECNYQEFLQQLEQLLIGANLLNGYTRGSLL
jgi:ribonuclease P protein component